MRNYGSVSNCLHTLERTLGKIKKAHPGAELRVAYEAGPTGFVMARRLAQLGIDCQAVLGDALFKNGCCTLMFDGFLTLKK